MKTLRELEREAYISGNTEMARTLADYIQCVVALESLTVHVREDVIKNRSTKHLFSEVERAEELTSRVQV